MLAPVAAPIAGAVAATGIGRGAIALGSRAAGSGVGTAVAGAFGSIREGLSVAAENSWGNAFFSRIAGPSMRAHAQNALAGQGVAQADMAMMNQIQTQTFAGLSTRAAKWDGWRNAFWREARQTSAFQQMFPAVGPGNTAPIYNGLGTLNLHHLHGRIEGLLFADSNLVLVPNALDSAFLHSAQYLTGTQQHLIRRGLRSLFPRQWTNGSLGSALGSLVPDFGDSNAGGGTC